MGVKFPKNGAVPPVSGAFGVSVKAPKNPPIPSQDSSNSVFDKPAISEATGNLYNPHVQIYTIGYVKPRNDRNI